MYNFCPTWLQIKSSHNLLPLGSDYLLEQLTELRETLTFPSLLKAMIKDADKQPDEEIHRARPGRVLSTFFGFFVLLLLF